MPTTQNQPTATKKKQNRPERWPASFAHQFGNALLGIKVLLEDFYERSVLSPEDTELLDIAIKECSRMQSMIDDIQTFSDNGAADTAKAPDQE
jgi:signal transduction histidine kinase